MSRQTELKGLSFFNLLARLISATSHFLGRLVANICVGIIYVMLVLLVVQVLMRYFLGAPPSWTEEMAIILFTWLVLLFATVGLRERFHVAIETIPISWSFAYRASERLVAGLVCGFGIVTLSAGISYVDRTSGQKTAALQLPIEVLYLCVPVCGALLILHSVALLFEPVHGQDQSKDIV